MESEEYGVAVMSKREGAVAPFVSSGFGHGSLPVFEPLEGDRQAGFEIEFIAETAE